MGGFSLTHILLFGLVAILLLGGGRFSNLMGDVAKGIKNFKKGMAEDEEATSADRPAARLDGRPANDIPVAETRETDRSI
ncbi:Sec-independent protein translocase subunit TatA [Sphingomonas lacunae]|uniref:Sec-independent protein translocase protein TatA n=1 Tax=Sphingomonas lacunae TaxID=2698828 RepID=A0A6M4AVZ4_9SPHN|nr:Sec-independent protein translocase subunit TatA [Sphingomonas lacunae]QJQ33317.1 Sec-independent protein translocase subunit TatA [Sphingomonas lacunae]